MSAPVDQTDWIPGASRLGWSAGFLFVFSATFLAACFALERIFPGAALATFNVDPPTVIGVIAIFAGIPIAAAWTHVVRMPAPRLRNSSTGLIIQEGAIPEEFPWDRVRIDGDMLTLVPEHYRIITRYRLSRFQAGRLGGTPARRQ